MYYEKLKRWCPNIWELDDEMLDQNFFENKIANIQTDSESSPIDVFKSELSYKFVKMGLNISLLQEFSLEGMNLIDEEPDEETILVTTIKNQSAEIKGQRDFEENALEFDTKDLRPGSAMRRPSSSMRRSTRDNSESGFR